MKEATDTETHTGMIVTVIIKFYSMSHITSIQELAQGFFEALGIELTGVEVTAQDEENHIYLVKISTTDSPLLIGPHGRTLEETQSLLIQMCEKVLGTHCLIHLEINDYLAEKQKRLFSIVDRKAELCQRNGIEQVIYELSGYERKQVHAYISETHPNIATKSIDGEKGRELHVMLKEGVQPTGEAPASAPTYSKPSSHKSDTTADLAKLDLDGTNI